MPMISKALKIKINSYTTEAQENGVNWDLAEAILKELNPKKGRPVGWRKHKIVQEGDIPSNNVIDT